FHVAQATEETLVVRASAQEGADELVTLSATDEVSGKIICLVVQQVGDWVEVQLPSGPADRTGWIARDEVTLSRHRFRIEVSRSDHSLTLYIGEIVALSSPVALGPDAPPAGEHLFIKELVEPPDPAGPYRLYAYGLSGADNALEQFTDGAGVVGIHGTADPTALGAESAAGAIGVGDDIMTRLVDTIGLPLGTPVDIVD
ncbi:MAG TPA: L,D-transpeptidase, partial [Acidimicrobiales bacterium]